MKKVLIITYYWPPSGGAGVQRWLKFAKYLREFGWEPVIFTPSNPESPDLDETLEKDIPANIRVIRTPIWEPYTFYKRLQGKKKEERIQAAFLSEKKQNPVLESISVWIRGNLFIPDARKFWIRPAVSHLLPLLKAEPVDAIVSTGPPHTTHLIARKLHDATGIPWLADFRDPWTQIDFYRELKLSDYADRKHHRLEKEVLKSATAVTVVSPSMADNFSLLHQRSYEVITNGYDPADLHPDVPVTRDKRFSIAHIGTLVGSRNPHTLWKALTFLIGEIPGLKDDLEIKLVGKVDHTVTESLEKEGLERFVNRIPYLTHPEAVKVQQQSQLLVLLVNNTPNAKSILTGKFFEYLAARRPVIAIGPVDGDVAAILQETAAGRISGFEDERTLRENILHYYQLYKEGKLEVASSGTERFSRRELTRRMAALLDSLK